MQGANATVTAPPAGTALQFTRPRQFWWKTALLALTTVSLVPVLLYKDTLLAEQAAVVYVIALVVVHLAGVVVIAIGVRRHQIAPDTRGLVIRLVGIAILVGLLYLAAKGITANAVTDWLFWGTLFAIWALHTLGLALLHLRTRREASVCPFV